MTFSIGLVKMKLHFCEKRKMIFHRKKKLKNDFFCIVNLANIIQENIILL